MNLPQDRGGAYLAKKYPEQVLYIPVQDSLELYDIDTKEDLEKLFLRQNNI
jgi:CTP:molybdopterin cytidylyltransferase MocA